MCVCVSDEMQHGISGSLTCSRSIKGTEGCLPCVLDITCVSVRCVTLFWVRIVIIIGWGNQIYKLRKKKGIWVRANDKECT